MVIVSYLILIIAYRIEKMDRDNVFTSKIYFSKSLSPTDSRNINLITTVFEKLLYLILILYLYYIIV